MATQKAIDIVGNNLGNIGVTGYTRQRVDMVSLGSNNRYTRFATKGSSLAGQGVNVSGVSQIRDPFLDKRFREESAGVGYYNKLAESLTDVQTALNEIVPSPVSGALKDFEAALKKMKEDGPSAVNNSSVLAAARNLTQVFKQMDNKLNSAWEQQRFDLQVDVNAVNSTLQNIAQLNDIIKKEVFSNANTGYGPNELLDQRNVLLDQLSQYGDINVKTNGDGTVTVDMGGKTVVEGDHFDVMSMVTNKQSNTVSVNWQSSGDPIEMGGGSLKASLEMLNGRGSDATASRGELFERGLPYYKDKINKFATTLADAFNNVIPSYKADGTPDLDANGDPIYKTLFTFTNSDSQPKTAGSFSINSEWEKDAGYIVDNIKPDGEGVYDTKFLDGIMANFTKELNFGEFKGNPGDYIIFYTTATLGNQVDSVVKQQESAEDIANSILDRITQISGVSQEEDGVDLMQYTKAYNAIGRVMTAMDEAMDVLINRTGLVGR